MKSYISLFSALLLLLPAITFAQGIQGYIGSILTFIGTVLMPFLFGIAFLVFAINVIRFFVVEGSNEDGREKAKALALYSVMALVIIIVFWGILGVLSKGTGLSGKNAPTPDYLEKNGVQLKSVAAPSTPTSAPTSCFDANGNPRPC